MKITCPNCNEQFNVDGAEYASLLNQVKNHEFDAEVKRQMAVLQQKFEAEQKAADVAAQQKLQEQLSLKDKALTAKDSEIAILKEKADNAAQAKQLELSSTIAEKDHEIAVLKEKVESAAQAKQLELSGTLAEKDQEIQRLKATIEQGKVAQQLAVVAEQSKVKETLQEQSNEITRLKNQIELEKSQAQNRENTLKEQYELQLSSAKEEIERIKDFKAKLSTKMIGESLEQHCSTEFNKVRMYAYPNAYFEKDNDASGGTKGDFIFRDYVDGQEYVSIMFEMKNENDQTATKHKNEDFFAKLDKDRNEKKCEYAVLVSMLEPESELYNEGIVDVSYRYPKMFVVRPQFFMPLIALLSQASRKSVDYIRELEIARSQSIDVTNFEEKVAKFRDAFGRNVGLAVKNHEDAISRIDTAIKSLKTIKELFEKSNTYLTRADRQLEEDFTVRKLTHKNPTMKAKFEEARKIKEIESDDE